MAKVKMQVTLGEPGSGKSYDLVNEVLELEKQDKSVYAFTPTRTATQRIINGYKQAYHKKRVTQSNLIWKAVRDTHTMQNNYKDEEYIFIDEFSMVTLDSFYALLYRIMNSEKEYVNIHVYADEKQLEPVNGVSCLILLFQSNSKKFKGIETLGFWNYVQTMLYDTLDDMNLDVPKSWQLAIDSIKLNINHKNYRLVTKDGISSYNEAFYQDMLKNNIVTERDYSLDLFDRIEKKYLIITPTHKIGKEIDNILKKQYGEGVYQRKAPFIRDGKDIWINPNCNMDYKFDFVRPFKTKQDGKKYEYSFYTTVHFCQGTTVDNAVFCMLNHNLPKSGAKQHYSRNLLYVAISRAKYNCEFFGKPTAFMELMTIYPENSGSIVSAQIASDTLNITYDTVIGMGDVDGHLSVEQFYSVYLENFDDIIKKSGRTIRDTKTINKNFQPKPYSFKKVISLMNPQNENQFTNGLIALGYDKTYQDYVDNSHKRGGQNSPVKKWLDSLTDEKIKQIKADLNLSHRQFKNKYKHDKRQVIKFLE